ncbi:hypothetical protein ACIB24_18960 [Spongisporangium articulatum]|uniref:Uncharacterized protein n=1 Tax=Spongisporangium articulatum TaxID=3362603 RepID=A0ABW8AS30_9ACTN
MRLYWIPLGAGGHVVRRSGLLYEAAAAAWARRPRQPLFHTALTVPGGGAVYAVELAPAWQAPGPGAEGPVGSRLLGRSSLFRYRVRCEPGGTIPDLDYARGGPTLLEGAGLDERVLRLVAELPLLTWGRDESGAGEMWNSNSVVSWLLTRAGVDTGVLGPPDDGRAGLECRDHRGAVRAPSLRHRRPPSRSGTAAFDQVELRRSAAPQPAPPRAGPE